MKVETIKKGIELLGEISDIQNEQSTVKFGVGQFTKQIESKTKDFTDNYLVEDDQLTLSLKNTIKIVVDELTDKVNAIVVNDFDKRIKLIEDKIEKL